MLNRRQWLLLALSEAPGNLMSPVQIQKTMFLFGQDAGNELGEGFYSFAPYDYGPFDPAIYRDLRTLESDGRVRQMWMEGRGLRRYAVTRRGRETAECLRAKADPRLRDFLAELVSWVTEQSFSNLIRNVYAAYPGYAVNSVFRAT